MRLRPFLLAVFVAFVVASMPAQLKGGAVLTVTFGSGGDSPFDLSGSAGASTSVSNPALDTNLSLTLSPTACFAVNQANCALWGGSGGVGIVNNTLPNAATEIGSSVDVLTATFGGTDASTVHLIGFVLTGVDSRVILSGDGAVVGPGILNDSDLTDNLGYDSGSSTYTWTGDMLGTTFTFGVPRAGNNYYLRSLTISYTEEEIVPEPATCLMLGTGLLGVWFAGRRRRRRA